MYLEMSKIRLASFGLQFVVGFDRLTRARLFNFSTPYEVATWAAGADLSFATEKRDLAFGELCLLAGCFLAGHDRYAMALFRKARVCSRAEGDINKGRF